MHPVALGIPTKNEKLEDIDSSLDVLCDLIIDCWLEKRKKQREKKESFEPNGEQK